MASTVDAELAGDTSLDGEGDGEGDRSREDTLGIVTGITRNRPRTSNSYVALNTSLNSSWR